MKLPTTARGFSLILIAALSLSMTAPGGQYFQDFNTFAPGMTIFSDGSALYSTSPGSVTAVADASLKELALTDAGTANTHAAFLLPDLDPGQAINGFSAKWNALVSGNFPTGGSGYSFSFGSVRAIDLINPAEGQENGYFSVPGLSVSIRTLNNTPGIYLRVNGTNVVAAATNIPAAFWGVNNSKRHFFEADWDSGNGLTLRVDGSVIFTNVATTGYAPSPGDSFVFGARTSTATETLRLDNIVVVTGGRLVPLTVTAPLYFSSETFSFEATKAFDGSPATSWRDSIDTTASLGGTVASAAVRCYVVNNGISGPAFIAPAAWQIQGGDGTNWSGFGNATVQFTNINESRAFMPTGNGSFPAWRLNNIQNSGGTLGVGLGELTFYGFQSTGLPGITNVQATVSSFPWVTFSAAVDPNGFPTTVVFELGTNTAYGWKATNMLAAANGNANVSATVNHPMLERQMPLYYRVQTFNFAGTNIVTGQATSQGFRLEESAQLGNLPAPTGLDNARFMEFFHDGKMALVIEGGVTTTFDAQTLILNNDVAAFRSGAADRPFPERSRFFGAIRGSLAVGELNGDNSPDFVFSGGAVSPYQARGTPVLRFVRSLSDWRPGPAFDSSGTIYDESDDALILDSARMVLADFDNDGKVDYLFTGSEYQSSAPHYTGPFAQMYRNVGAQSGSQNTPVGQRMGRGVSPVGRVLGYGTADSTWASTLEAGDLDGDGYPEVYEYAFESGSSQISRIYHNDQEMGLSPRQDLPVLPVSWVGDHRGSSAVFADFNGDGHLDLLTGGEGSYNSSSGTNITRILYNDGTGILTNSGISLPGWGGVAFAVGDIFNHGRNDIVMCGVPAPADPVTLSRTMVFRNDGNQFTPVDFGLRPIASNTGHGLDLGDYDEDGRLDLAGVGGLTSVSAVELTDDSVSIYRNTLDIPSNQPPSTASGLASSVGAGSVVLSWTNAVDDITPKNLLTYNVYVTTVPVTNIVYSGATDYSNTNILKVSPMANFITGKRKVPQPGNAGHAYRHPWRLPPGTYYWSVQAIDGGYAGGPWAPEQTFTITEPEHPPVSAAKATNGTLVAWSGHFSDFQLEYKDSLSTGNWITNSIPVGYTNGKANVLYTNGPGSRFFRLRK